LSLLPAVLLHISLINLPQGGYGSFPTQENDDHSPARVKPRNILNLGVGSDNLLHRERPRRITASIEVANLTNIVALYNFLSTFSGTHFLQPMDSRRSRQVHILRVMIEDILRNRFRRHWPER
jgi:hypothetical protein